MGVKSHCPSGEADATGDAGVVHKDIKKQRLIGRPEPYLMRNAERKLSLVPQSDSADCEKVINVK
jgi:hypothetical protein